jgi:hypothetical protein
VLTWLRENGLQADLAKSELMVFAKKQENPDLIGVPIRGARY